MIHKDKELYSTIDDLNVTSFNTMSKPKPVEESHSVIRKDKELYSTIDDVNVTSLNIMSKPKPVEDIKNKDIMIKPVEDIMIKPVEGI